MFTRSSRLILYQNESDLLFLNSSRKCLGIESGLTNLVHALMAVTGPEDGKFWLVAHMSLFCLNMMNYQWGESFPVESRCCYQKGNACWDVKASEVKELFGDLGGNGICSLDNLRHSQLWLVPQEQLPGLGGRKLVRSHQWTLSPYFSGNGLWLLI